MPRCKRPGMLERNALADLWKHTLSQIPNTYGRLAYLASLRDPNSGSYRHYGFSAAFGREDSTLALRKSHEDTFLEWLQMPLAAKSEALRAYFQTLGENPWALTTYLIRGMPYLSQMPDSATRAQRRQFQSEMEILIELLRNEYADDHTNQAASGAYPPK